MKSRLPLIVIAVVLAALLTFVIFQNIEGYKRQLDQRYTKMLKGLEPVPVVLAAKDLKSGILVAEDMLKVDKVPGKAAQPYALENPLDAIGKELLVPLAQGQQFLHNHLVIPGAGGTTLASRIPPDKRAISVEIAPVTSVSGFIRPADHVDLLWTFALKGAEGQQPVVITLFQNVEVLAVGPYMRAPSSGQGGATAEELRTLTLALVPQEIELLLFAQTQGALQFSLRSRAAGEERIALPPVTFEALLQHTMPELAPPSAPPPPPPPTPLAPPKRIEVIRGTDREVVTISATGEVATQKAMPEQAPDQPPMINPELLQNLLPLLQQQPPQEQPAQPPGGVTRAQPPERR